MNKKILTMEEVLKNLTYDVTNICYKDNIKPIFKVTEEGFRYKAFQLAKNGEYAETSVLTKYYSDNWFVDISCLDEDGNKIDIIKTHTDIRGVDYFTVDSSYWESHDKIIVSCYDPEDRHYHYKETYDREHFIKHIPCYDYSIVESSCDDITTLKDTNLFVETNEGFVMVDAKILHKLLIYLSK